MAIRTLLLAALVLFAMGAQEANACTCSRQRERANRVPSAEALEYVDHVFEAIVGEPEIDERGPGLAVRVSIEVLRVWKGDVPTHLILNTGLTCPGTLPASGTRVLFYGVYVQHCTVVFPASSPQYDAHIAWLREAIWTAQTGYLRGGCAHCNASDSPPSPLGTMVGVGLLAAAVARRRRRLTRSE